MSLRIPLVLLAGLCGLRGETVARFQALADCRAFFYRGLPPSGFVGPSQVRLCQRLAGKMYFATLYDRSGRLPVYSASIYKHRAAGDPREKGVDRTWKYESQLVDPQSDANMTEISPRALRDPAVRRSQAVAGAYPMRLGELNYVRGQLSPGNFQGSRLSRSATYTVTNAVTYPRLFHHGGWKPGLARTAQRLREGCQGSRAYMVSGAVRRRRGKEEWAPRVGKGRAALPQMLWSAFCCGNGASGALLGHAEGSGTLRLGEGAGGLALGPYQTQDITVEQLETLLAAHLGRKRVQIFEGGCTPI
ncbi:endonuclease domain-containing 1 protein-like [Heptranchias perlo]|uniref:endonuclease domain-containing 1 protein-like n=1 Tax=Heptranchias perlo TaxID=212740 RepID=UPI00355A2D40